MSRYAFIDLSSLPAPDVIEPLDYESILADIKADYASRNPEFGASTLESDPIVKLQETAAYRELLVRQRANDAARQRMLAFATGTNLDHEAARVGVQRLLLDAGDPEAVPPVAPTYESDDDLRLRAQLAPEAMSTAGGEASYIFNALTAGETPATVEVASPAAGMVIVTYTFDPDGVAGAVKDASVQSPEPGTVLVTILGRTGDGSVDSETIDAVTARLSGKYVRPLCEDAPVQGATISSYTVTAELEIYDGPDKAVVLAAAGASLQATADKRHALGENVTADVLDAALHVPGVRKVNLIDWEDVICDDAHAPYMTASDISEAEA